MAYRDDIANLTPEHHWPFEDDSLDEIGAVNGSDTSILYTATAIARDASNAMHMNARGDRVALATTTNINNSAQARKAIAGWIMVDSYELPFCRIYGEGNNTTTFQFILQPGNTVTLEVRDGATWQVQIYSDVALAPNRAYHLVGILEGSAHSNEVKLFLDGVEQTAASPDRVPDDASLAARGVAEWGDPAGTVGLNGTALLMNSPGDNVTANQVINAYYNHWVSWGDTANAQLTDTEVRVELFEKGALGDQTIATGTQGAMQTAIDAFASTVRGDAACCIEVEAVSGGGNFELDLDNITFNSLASIHIRYNGTADTLTVRNTNGSNASIGSAPFGGTLAFVTEQTITVTVVDAVTGSPIQNARVLLEADTGGDLAAGTDIIGAVLTNASGVVSVVRDFTNDQPVVGRVRRGAATYYKSATIVGTITSDGFDVIVQMVPDE